MEENTLPEIESIIINQRDYFKTGNTYSYEFRKAQLIRLKQLVKEYEPKILAALNADLNKSNFDGWAVEIGVIEHELNLAIQQLKSWMSRRRLRTPLLHAIGSSYQYPEPYGNILIISPWNYPFLLAMRPVIGAIAAGNTCIIKPSEFSIHTSLLLADMINNNFKSDFLFVLNTDAAGTQELLKYKFNYIFFTGSPSVGNIVYQAAAKHLTPVTLELGGKNPCIVDADINLEIAARRIAWGKFSNAGQTCVAPDYIIVHKKIKEKFIALIIENLKRFYGDDPELSNDYGRMIHRKQFNRIESIIINSKIIYGGQLNVETLFISPTIVEITNMNEVAMQEEIFGPVLPIVNYENIEEAIQITKMHHDPLVCYLFTKNKKLITHIQQQIPAGDMCINDVVVHFGHSNLPIGGRGNSGIGKYQGKYNFETFSHLKSVLHKTFIPDLSVRYPPFNNSKFQRIKKLFNWFFN